MADLTTAGVIAGIVAGLGGLALGIWNRIELWRDHRAQRNARKPHFDMLASQHADNAGWRPLQFVFYNPTGRPFIVETIEIRTGKVQIAPVRAPGVGIGPYSGIGTAPDTSMIGSSVSVAWTIAADASGSTSPIHRIFWQPNLPPFRSRYGSPPARFRRADACSTCRTTRQSEQRRPEWLWR